MGDSNLYTNELQALQSVDELSLLDAIDSLRSQGLSHYVPLPQLVVCGDQSSGKSSVLEAISGVPFPTKDNLCTRFATELVLRRTVSSDVSITIVPSQSRSEAECQRLAGFRETLVSFDSLPAVMEKAKHIMGTSNATTAFFHDVLRVEISGPDRPHLTIVDLPGLIHSENKVQTAVDVAFVLSLVKQYMANRRSIILAVVSAKNDFANQIVTKLAKEVDSNGHRTLGIITKPDTLPTGSESEAAYANLARNQEVEFRLGWHTLRNRSYETRDIATEQRDAQEKDFFSQGIWGAFPRSDVGISSLRARLSKVLLEQIRSELPSLSHDIESCVQDTRKLLAKIGSSRATFEEQRLFLLQISQSFQSLVGAAVDGSYGNAFFGNPRLAEGYSKRLRAVVQNLNLDFAELMRTKGHQRKIVERVNIRHSTAKNPRGPTEISRDDYLKEITELLKRSRGRELPGMFNPLIVGDLFYEQSKPWDDLLVEHVNVVWGATHAFLELAFASLTDQVTAEEILREVIRPAMEDRLKMMRTRLVELSAAYQKGHPITYNHYFTETIQNMRQKRLEAEVARRLNTLYSDFDITKLEELPARKIKSASLISALTSRNEADMDLYASSEVLDCMQAYYKVALKSIIDNVAVQVIEILLIRCLDNVFSPAYVLQMNSSLISRIAAEPKENSSQREYLLRKLAVLQAGAKTCTQFARRGVMNLHQDSRPVNSAPEDEDGEGSYGERPLQILADGESVNHADVLPAEDIGGEEWEFPPTHSTFPQPPIQ